MSKAKRLPIVMVEWIDACSLENGWNDMKDAKEEKPAAVHSVGFLIANTKDRVTVVASHDASNETVNGGITIPKGWVVKITPLSPHSRSKSA